MPDIDIPASEFAGQFWAQAASYFCSAPHVLFEIYNEPADIRVKEWRISSAHLNKPDPFIKRT